MFDPDAPPGGMVALVVDGYGPVGRLVCARLGAEGMSIAVVGGSAHRASLFCKELAARYVRALPYLVDSAEESSVEQLVADVTGDLGRIDALIDLAPDRSTPHTLLDTAERSLRARGRSGRVLLLAAGDCVSGEHISATVLMLLAPQSHGLTGRVLESKQTAGS
ncbi:SDR family NAD(P)-dependent oxidoreductase [Streptomyces sp. NPDC058401]|uniref:SDR family NAD(P)-dependent oxidoreductase n=1 Tax=Streptomyces sp. NPDC058401 TaxID=3346480 RepID=UPI0036629414